MFKTFNKVSRLNSYILFGSVHCSGQSSNGNIYVVPVYHLNTGIQGSINISISLNRKKYVVIMVAYVIGQTIIFLPCDFYLLSIFFFISSPNLSGRRLDVYRTCRHGVALVRI